MLKLLVAGAILAFPSLAAAEAVHTPASAEPSREVALSAAQVEQLDIKLLEVRPTNEQTAALLPGTVVPALNARVVAASPFAGTVIQIHVLPGQAVSKGAPLATISSRELLDAQSTLAQSEAELQATDATARRKRMMADKNIQSPMLADEAEAHVAKIQAVISQHKRSLAIGGITLGDGGTYTISAPESGRVVHTNASPGDKLESMSPAITIDTSVELSIEVQVPADLVAHIKAGDRIRVIDGPEGKVVSIGGTLDKLTRSAKLIASVPLKSGLIAGQMVNVAIVQQAETGALSVPSSAVARINENHGVFVRNTTGFSLVPVKVTGRTADAVTISGGIIAHDARVAASGLPQLEQLLGTQ